MVKIRVKFFLISILLMVFLMSSTYAATNKLIFDHVDVKVGSRTSSNLHNGDTIRDEAKPGDNLEFRITMKNNYTNAEILRIEDITVKTTVENIDDGDDFDDESNTFTLSPGSTKKVTLKFKVPLEVEESTFDVLIEADGSDKNGTSQDTQMTIRLDVNKQSHQLKITKFTLSPAEITCTRKNVKLNLELLNIGTEDENTVNIEIKNSDLGIDIKDQTTDLLAETNSGESKFSKVYSFNIASNVEAGSYPISVRALYNDDRKATEGTATLTVNDCQQTQTKQENKTQNVDTSTQPSSTSDKTTVIVQQLPPGTVVSTEGFFKGNGFIIGVVIAEIIAVVIGIALLIILFGR